jgi:hypothetical protein
MTIKVAEWGTPKKVKTSLGSVVIKAFFGPWLSTGTRSVAETATAKQLVTFYQIVFAMFDLRFLLTC